MATPVNEIHAPNVPRGELGQKHLVTGTHVGLRLWEHDRPTRDHVMHSRPYETVGYVLEGHARLHLGAQTLALDPGDSYLVPAGADHAYEIVRTPFRCVEATSPPARPSGRK